MASGCAAYREGHSTHCTVYPKDTPADEKLGMQEGLRGHFLGLHFGGRKFAQPRTGWTLDSSSSELSPEVSAGLSRCWAMDFVCRVHQVFTPLPKTHCATVSIIVATGGKIQPPPRPSCRLSSYCGGPDPFPTSPNASQPPRVLMEATCLLVRAC